MCELHRDEQLRPASGTSKEDVRGGWRLRFEAGGRNRSCFIQRLPTGLLAEKKITISSANAVS